MADLKNTIRNIVQEELAKTTTTQSSPGALYRRAQDLIRSSSQSLSQELASNSRPQGQGHSQHPQPSTSSMSNSTTTTATTQQYLQEGQRCFTPLPVKRKSHPNHPWRYQSSKKKMPKCKPAKAIYCWLLDLPLEEDPDNEYSFEDEMVLVKSYAMLSPDQSTLGIKETIAESFSVKIPGIEAGDFEFVKRERMKISVPATTSSFEWSFENLKRIWGQGKLYCRLNR